MASIKIAFYVYYLSIISPGMHVYVYYMFFCKITSRKLFKISFFRRSHMGTLCAKTFKWRPGHVPYLPYPRYATGCEFEPGSWWGVLDTILCDTVRQWLVTGLWFSPGTPVSSTNKSDRRDIAEILFISGVKQHKPSLKFNLCRSSTLNVFFFMERMLQNDKIL